MYVYAINIYYRIKCINKDSEYIFLKIVGEKKKKKKKKKGFFFFFFVISLQTYRLVSASPLTH